MNCDQDYCNIDDEHAGDTDELKGLNGEARKKLLKWLGMEPMDYDAPGTTVRESGV